VRLGGPGRSGPASASRWPAPWPECSCSGGAWRPLVRPLPEALPALETHALSYVRKQEQEEMSYRTANGTFIFMKWSEGGLVELRVY